MKTKKKNLAIGISVLTIAVAAAVNVNFALKNNGLSALSLANVEAFAGTTPGEENPPQLGSWSEQSKTFVTKQEIGGVCYNVYTVKKIFTCGSGTEYETCGTISTAKLQVPCTC